MTKKQNRLRGFGRRSLSVLLATLMLLSTMVVMLTSTMLTVGAGNNNTDIDCWYVVGPFNNWSVNNDYKLNWSSANNQWEGKIPPVVATSSFKLIARKKNNGGDFWNGLTGTAPVSLGSDTALKWQNPGEDSNEIKLTGSGTNNPEYLNFFVYSKDGGNHFSVTSKAWDTTGNNHGGKTYSAPAAVTPGNTDTEDGQTIFWAKATYYDYLSDWEKDVSSWLKPIQAGTGFNWSNDDWYPFYGFNRDVIKPYADNGWENPLYFGNFCYTNGSYDTSGHHPGTSNGFNDAIGSSNVTNFKYVVNNSNATNNGAGGQGLADNHQSYQGLMNSSLGANGELLIANSSTEAPYFNSTKLGNYANTVNSAFPFRVIDNGGTYKTYQFDSNDGTDNVYFGWENDSSNSSTKPTSVHYGGSSYAISDGLGNFLTNEGSGKGIFPFNGGTGTKTNTNNNLDYGFGIKMEVKFRVPKPNETTGINTENDPITFEFSGDDDMWMYITDEDGNSYLVLDMGGNHKKSTGTVDFNALTSTVDHVYQGDTQTDKSETWHFAEDIGLVFDYSKTYTMTVFYMERGLIESNCKMTFSMYPAGNQVNVEKEVNTASINRTSTSHALQDAVAAADSFDFTASQANTVNGTYTVLKNTEYMDNYYGNKKTNPGNGSFALEDTENASFLSQFKTNNYVKIAEADPNDGKNLSYTTKWSVSDPFKPSRNLTDQEGLTTTAMRLVEKGTTSEPDRADPNEYAQLDYKFVNTPDIGTVKVTKTVDNPSAEDLEKEFNATVEISLAGGAAGTFFPYPLTYTATGLNGSFETDASGNLSSSALLKHDRTLTFSNLPAKAVVKVTEQLSEEDALLYEWINPDDNTATVTNGGIATITVENNPLAPQEINMALSGFTKKLDDVNYTGDLFRFVAEGVPRFSGDPDNVVDTSSEFLQTTEVTDGEFTFGLLSFVEPGVYRYHIYEDTNYPALLDAGNLFTTSYADDYEAINTEYLVSITVTKVGGELVASDPVYYNYSSYEQDISDGTPGTPLPHTMSSADFSDSMKLRPGETPIFNNYLNKGNVRIVKKDQTGTIVDGVTFAVYKVSDEFVASLADMTSDVEKYDAVKALGRRAIAGGATTGPDGGFESGVAEIYDLPIYQDGFVTSDANGKTIRTTDPATHQKIVAKYQQYILIEQEGPDTYSLNKQIQILSFPTAHEYNLTYNYINEMLKSPSTAGPGMTMFKLIGLALAGFSVMALGGYILYTKKYAKRKTAKHFAK